MKLGLVTYRCIFMLLKLLDRERQYAYRSINKKVI